MLRRETFRSDSTVCSDQQRAQAQSASESPIQYGHIAAEIIRRLARRVLDPVIAGIVAELPIFELAVAVLTTSSWIFLARRLNRTLALASEQEKNSAFPFCSTVLFPIASLMQSLVPDEVTACGLIWA